MLRRFRQHNLRKVTDFNGIWDFAFLGDVDPDQINPSEIDYDDTMSVPGCFDATPAYAGIRGLTAYRTTSQVTGGKLHRLVFGNVHHWCRVIVDGKPLGDHDGGWTNFSMDFTPAGDGRAEIVVLVDNRFTDRSPMHVDFYDWYHYGGLAGGVELHRLDELRIDAIRIITTDYRTRSVRLELDYSADVQPGPTPLTIYFDDQPIEEQEIELSQGSGTLEMDLELEGAELWSPEEPNLYGLRVILGTDDIQERFGIRQIATSGRKLLLNGEELTLMGVNRHALHTLFGCGLPEQTLVSDIQQIVDLGCNFVRGAHYPQDPRFLDLCDEYGLCVWVESIGWSNNVRHFENPAFMDSQKRHIEEMVAQSISHPSVIVWAVLNEGHSENEACRPAYAELIRHLRQLDDSRPVTFATCRYFEDKCLDLADIICINCYPGWYRNDISEIGEELDKFMAWPDEEGHSDKPMMISEIGAGALPGWRDWHEQRWTEQYQVRYLQEVINHLLGGGTDRACGLCIWQFGDIRTSETPGMMRGKPRGFNNKGLVDEYRRPKPAYYTVRDAFRELRGMDR
ncbi:MAG: glycoside hydrolase family 2 protein [Phycisphaerae bacterium]